MRAFAGVAVALGASFVASTAWGHGARPSVFDIVERDGGVVGMATTFGVIHDGGDGLTWSCTAAVPATPTGYLFAGDDVIATTTDGLYVSDDSGCTWSEHPSDIAAPVVTEVRRDGADGGSTWLVTADLDAPNGVYRSDDDGRTWDAFGPTLDDTALYGLAVAEGRVVVTALNAEVGWSVLDWTADAAEPVADVPEGLLDVEVWIAGDRVWLADIRMRDSTFYGHDADTDAFVAWGDPVEGVITDVVEADGDVLVATDTSDVYRATPAGLERLEGENVPVILDVRSPEEFAEGHIPGAINVPYDQVAANLDSLESFRTAEIVVYCRTGRRAGVAENVMREAGFSRCEPLEIKSQVNLFYAVQR